MSALRSLLALLAAAVVFAFAAFSPQIFNDGETFWRICTRQWILAHGQMPHLGLRSSGLPTHAWTAQAWLSEVPFASAFNLLGWSGVALFDRARGIVGGRPLGQSVPPANHRLRPCTHEHDHPGRLPPRPPRPPPHSSPFRPWPHGLTPLLKRGG